MDELLNALVSLYKLISDSAVSTLFAVTGFFFFAVTALLVHHVTKSRPEDITPLHKRLLYISMGTALLLSIAAPSLRMLELHRAQAAELVAAANTVTILQDLHENKKVHWLARLIPYTIATKQFLNVNTLTNLGRCEHDPCGAACKQQYVFVADYDELKGLTAEQAVLKVGGAMDEVIGVTAIIFPLYTHDLFPANARGVLQVVRSVDGVCKAKTGYKTFSMNLSSDEVLDLTTKRVKSYAWDAYGRFYEHYCKLAQQFRCAEQDKSYYSAAEHIGSLSSDWHPLGFSRTAPEPEPCGLRQVPCSIVSWSERNSPVPDVGARVFLIQNFPLDQLGGRVMIDFDNPTRQLLPRIDERILGGP